MEQQKRSLFSSVKDKLSSRTQQNRQDGEVRPTRSDSQGAGSSYSGHWNSLAFASSSASQPAAACDAPPAYTPSSNPFLSAPNARNRDASPTPSIASVSTPEDKYAFLGMFDTILVIHDSGSMAGSSWKDVRQAVSAITPICTDHDADGIDVHFLNHKASRSKNGGYTGIRDVSQVKHLFSSVKPGGATPTGTTLHRILKPYVDSLVQNKDNMENIKPINIIVVTDGCPTDDPESIIVQCAKKLDAIDAPPYQVGLQFFQIGTDPGATEALRELDDELAEQGIRDIVDTVTWDASSSNGLGGSTKQLTADGILKVVLGAVVRRLDRKVIGRRA